MALNRDVLLLTSVQDVDGGHPQKIWTASSFPVFARASQVPSRGGRMHTVAPSSLVVSGVPKKKARL